MGMVNISPPTGDAWVGGGGVEAETWWMICVLGFDWGMERLDVQTTEKED